MIASLTIGGATAASCETCGARIGSTCLSPSGAPCKKPHAARVRSAPPETTAHVGDLIEVHGTNGIHVAHLHAITDASAVVVRYWKPGAQRFGPPTPVRASLVARLAPDNVRTRLAREELKIEEGIASKIRFTGLAGEAPPPALAPDLAPDLLADRGPFDAPREVGQSASAPVSAAVSMPEDP